MGLHSRRLKQYLVTPSLRFLMMSGIMKTTSQVDEQNDSADDLLPEYHFDYHAAKPNRFAAQVDAGSRVVRLDPDVAAVFTTPEAVNKVLRALIATMPQPTRS